MGISLAFFPHINLKLPKKLCVGLLIFNFLSKINYDDEKIMWKRDFSFSSRMERASEREKDKMNHPSQCVWFCYVCVLFSVRLTWKLHNINRQHIFVLESEEKNAQNFCHSLHTFHFSRLIHFSLVLSFNRCWKAFNVFVDAFFKP